MNYKKFLSLIIFFGVVFFVLPSYAMLMPQQVKKIQASHKAHQIKKLIHLIPTSPQDQSQLGLIRDGLSYTYTKFNTDHNRFDFLTAPADSPTTIHIQADGKQPGYTMIQLFTINQFELANKKGLSGALCGGHSIYNAVCIQQYATTGDKQCLLDMHDEEKITKFFCDLKLTEGWLEVLPMVNKVKEVQNNDYIPNKTNSTVTVVSSLELFDSQLSTKPYFESLIGPRESVHIKAVKKAIEEGLKNNEFMHTVIVGNEEAVMQCGHYFGITVIKYQGAIQVVITDTASTSYHLHPNSHERNRIQNFIENILVGFSEKEVVNLKAKLFGMY